MNPPYFKASDDVDQSLSTIANAHHLATKLGIDDTLAEVRYEMKPNVAIIVDVHDLKAFCVSPLPERTPEGVHWVVTPTDEIRAFMESDLTPDDAEAIARGMAHASKLARRLNVANPETDSLAAMFVAV